uniref:PAS domain-containing protein n=1 Tax=Chromera velia CCMP2878 TaxID=1169474 RepID=A0A0G4I9I7_9ALVE|eukprot:Cvel_12172.t1-p1 / transcript=Cvel_12172.t1 / gene=Cvel_12172 / organism=Chromera_velia_CCMP2878 / gene_product=Uncharacterized transporter YrhG, putative / transcript_product=Uncharacterized transporter YrhG, putative / location=Cvel_scaffold786:2900-7197(-) / protein_length=557 / sequence_SO=supercontig / SO=protein_coding / is_pseudo=false
MAEGNVSHSVASTQRQFLIPKEIVVALTNMGFHKANQVVWKTVVGSIIAGFWVVFGGIFALTVAGGVSKEVTEDLPSLQKTLVGTTFWVALVFILTYGGELLTGNMMYLSLALANRRITIIQACINWSLVLLGNAIGCIFLGWMLGYEGELFKDEPWKGFVKKVGEGKVAKDFHVVFIKGIGANWMVCLAVSMAVASQDQISRTISCFLAVALFATVGLEHCVANLFFVPLAMMYGSQISVGDFLWKNLIPSILGNYVGGALFCGGGLFLLYQFEPFPVCTGSGGGLVKRKPTKKGGDDGVKELHRQLARAKDSPIEFPRVAFVKRYMKATGEVIVLTVDATVVMSPDGKPERIIAYMRYTPRGPLHVQLPPQRQASEQLQQQPLGESGTASAREGLLSADKPLTEMVGLLSMLWDGEQAVEDLRIDTVDETLCTILGYRRNQLVGLSIAKITYIDDQQLSSLILRSAVDRLTLKNRLADPSSRNLPLPAVVGVNSDEDEENDQGQGGSPLMLKPPGGDSEKDRRKKVRTAATAADVSSPKRILEEGQEGQSGGEHV